MRWIQAGLFFALVLGPGTALRAEQADLLVTETSGRFGGNLVVALRNEPKTFNPVLAGDEPSLTVIRRIMADLVHIDRRSQMPVPALARSWKAVDGRRFRLELRRGVRFSDGHPLDADDVVFTFRVYLDEAVGSPNRDLLIVGDKPVTVRKLGSHTLEVELAEPYAVGVRLFDSLAILPEHRLGQAWREGRFQDAWSLGTPPEAIVGLGPFRIKRHTPGERLELERNPHYWKVDAAGRRLPYLDRITFLFVADKEAQTLRFQAGETHLIDRLGAASFAMLRAHQDRGGYVLEDLGAGLAIHFLFFNLNDLAGRDLPAVARKQVWFGQRSFRRAVSKAIDRQAIVRLVYQGRATPIAAQVTPGNKLWYNDRVPPAEYSPRAALSLLREAGFVRDGDRLVDGYGNEAAFSILYSSSNEDYRRTAILVQEDLSRLGFRVQVVPMELRALLDRVFETYDYEACLLGLGGGDVDPNPDIAVLHTGGSHRFWNLAPGPAKTDWEKRIDLLLDRQAGALDPAERRRLYGEVQELVAENQPMIFLVSPNVLVGARTSVGSFEPAVLEHQTLWNVDELYLETEPPTGSSDPQ